MPIAGNPEDLSRGFNNAGYNFIKQFRELMNHAIDIGADVLRQTEAACKNADLIIHTFAHAVGGHTLACEQNIPDIHIQGFPMFTPTGDYPNVTLPNWHLRPWNRFTHYFSLKLSWWGARFGYEQVRRRAGLPKRKLYSPFDVNRLRPPTPILCAWSPQVIPTSGDWPSHVYVTGYFFGEDNSTYQPPAELQEFLQAGDAPICISFGSMLNRDATKIDLIVRDALNQTGHRGLILSGWSNVNNASSDQVLYLPAVPHQWLLPHCKMIIHHGGAGTTSAGLRAGIPNIVIPHTADQPFWGSVIHNIGVGPKPIPVRKLSVEGLAFAISESNSPVLLERARSISEKLKGEDGVGTSVQLMEKHSYDFLRKNR